MSDGSPFLNGQPVSEEVRRVQVQVVKTARRPDEPILSGKRKTLLERKSRKG